MNKKDTIEYTDDRDVSDGGEGEEGRAEAKIKKLKEDLKRCDDTQKEYLDGWQRSKADFINYKKDEAKRFQGVAQMGVDDIVQDILVVLDSFHLARQYDMPPRVAEGVAMIQGQLEDILRKRGLRVIPVKPGDAFDPRVHESIGEIESDYSPGAIAEEAQKGYEIDGRVLRPSRVKISKEKSSSA